MLVEVIGAHRYHAKTGKNYVPPVRPPVYDPRIIRRRKFKSSADPGRAGDGQQRKGGLLGGCKEEGG